MSLLYPVAQVLLLAVIDFARDRDDKVFRIDTKLIRIKWKIGGKAWVKVARIGLPISFLILALLIVVPGIVNVTKFK